MHDISLFLAMLLHHHQLMEVQVLLLLLVLRIGSCFCRVGMVVCGADTGHHVVLGGGSRVVPSTVLGIGRFGGRKVANTCGTTAVIAVKVPRVGLKRIQTAVLKTRRSSDRARRTRVITASTADSAISVAEHRSRERVDIQRFDRLTIPQSTSTAAATSTGIILSRRCRVIVLVLLHGEGSIIIDRVEKCITCPVESAPASAFYQECADQGCDQSQEGGNHNSDNRSGRHPILIGGGGQG